jgi:hypothetical protein
MVSGAPYTLIARSRSSFEYPSPGLITNDGTWGRIVPWESEWVVDSLRDIGITPGRAVVKGRDILDMVLRSGGLFGS